MFDIKNLELSLPKAPGICDKSEYFNSVVLLSLIEIDSEMNILFQKRSKHIRQAGEICLPGGMCDEKLDKSLEDTAIRETSEELGISRKKIDILGCLNTIVSPMGTTIDVFVGIIHEEIKNMKINSDEVEKIFTLPISFFKNNKVKIYKTLIKTHPYYIDDSTNEKIVLLPSQELGLPQIYHKPWGNFIQKVYLYNSSEGSIWGLTAKIINEFIKHIKK